MKAYLYIVCGFPLNINIQGSLYWWTLFNEIKLFEEIIKLSKITQSWAKINNCTFLMIIFIIFGVIREASISPSKHSPPQIFHLIFTVLSDAISSLHNNDIQLKLN